MRALSLARNLIGALLLWASAGAAGYAISWTLRSHEVAAQVMAHAPGRLAAEKAYSAGTSCRAGTPRPGQLAGLVEVPSLSMKAPVEQGESSAVLSASVGHDPSSVWPGSDGTSVLAAHDVSFFARIGQLRPGDRIIYVSACRTVTFVVTGHRIVPSGSPVSDSSGPSLVLDTCWPNDALWWTPDRELVTARELSSRPSRESPGEITSHEPAVQGEPVAVPVPPGLAAQGLTLDTNPTLLGTMQVSGRPAPDLVQSPEPLDVEEAALTAYYGALHSIAGNDTAWFAELAPGVPFPGALAGGHIPSYVTRLAVDLRAQGDQVTGVRLSAVVSFSTPSGGTRNLPLTVFTRISKGELTISGWQAG